MLVTIFKITDGVIIIVDRIHSIDFMKGISIFIVVYFHTMLFDGNQINRLNIWLLLFPRFVIPFFFIASGFFLGINIKKRLNYTKYFKGYILKLVKVFVVWYFIYLIYDCVVNLLLAIHMGLEIKSEIARYFLSIPKLGVLYYGMGNTSYHLWFLTALIWSMIILFLFIKLKKLHLLLVISLLLNIIGLFGQTYSGIFHLPLDTRDALFFGLFYTTLGCYIAFNFEKVKQLIAKVKAKTIIYLFILATILQAAESVITRIWLDGTKGGMGYYLSTIPLTVFLFLLLIKNKNFGHQSIISWIGKNAIGIYVAHMGFISIFNLALQFFDIEWLRKSLLFNFFLALVILILSYYFFVFFMKFGYKMIFMYRKMLSTGRVKLFGS
ncbi:acyltransferase family protein [Lederbergia citri]|uniref:Acyltransferase n=1 Tax=Lederbergia citri TaxID=2833580 RepID=A0A942THA9_9BACI|nr:acyltransferase [Lederbergia citri]MBS4197603.1 acyltransferase [Lederbergia citri]